MTNEIVIFGFMALSSILGVTTFLYYRKSVKSLNETIDDKKVIINELIDYAEKISETKESVKVKKPLKKQKVVKTVKPTKKVEVKPTKKVEVKPTKKESVKVKKTTKKKILNAN